MRDKERLEMLENGSSFSNDDITFLLKQARLYQISRDDTREKCHEVRQQNKELEQQIKRYREALELVIKKGTYGTSVHTGEIVRNDEADIAFKALESDSDE